MKKNHNFPILSTVKDSSKASIFGKRGLSWRYRLIFIGSLIFILLACPGSSIVVKPLTLSDLQLFPAKYIASSYFDRGMGYHDSRFQAVDLSEVLIRFVNDPKIDGVLLDCFDDYQGFISLHEINKYDLYEVLFNSISKTNLGAVIDVTDQFVQLELKGKNIYEIFSAGSPFNFNEFKEKKGSTTQTVLNHVDVILHNKDENIVNLFVRRSFAEHLYSWIEDNTSRL